LRRDYLPRALHVRKIRILLESLLRRDWQKDQRKPAQELLQLSDEGAAPPLERDQIDEALGVAEGRPWPAERVPR
jgi:hypothetical protein